MRRSKLLGAILITATFVYLLAAFLAAYQNQRVTMEKGIAEAVKAYAEREVLERKEQNKEADPLAEDKISLKDKEQQILKFEGSFDRVESSIHDVTGGMEKLEYSIDSVKERIETIEKEAVLQYEKTTEEFTFVEKEMDRMEEKMGTLEGWQNTKEEKLKRMEEELEAIEKEIAAMEEMKAKVDSMEEHILYYQWDDQTESLTMHGK